MPQEVEDESTYESQNNFISILGERILVLLKVSNQSVNKNIEAKTI